MPTPIPQRSQWGLLSLLTHATAAFPEQLTVRLPHFDLSRTAQRSITLRPAGSFTRPRRSVTPKASMNSLPPPPIRLLRVGAIRRRTGLAPAENHRRSTAHNYLTQRLRTYIAVLNGAIASCVHSQEGHGECRRGALGNCFPRDPKDTYARISAHEASKSGLATRLLCYPPLFRGYVIHSPMSLAYFPTAGPLFDSSHSSVGSARVAFPNIFSPIKAIRLPGVHSA
jgi:hypothetical protein